MLVIIFGCLIAKYIYDTEYKVTKVSEYTNPTNQYNVVFQAVGAPEWPFGSTQIKITLLDDVKKVVKSFKYYINDDGARAGEHNIHVKWFENYVEITLSGSEQEDDIYKIDYE